MTEHIIIKIQCWVCKHVFHGDDKPWVIRDGRNYCHSCVTYMRANGLWVDVQKEVTGENAIMDG
jgi:hypothetical protein